VSTTFLYFTFSSINPSKYHASLFLNLTGRTYRDVLNAASWAVFQEGYTRGFGADGDHLKTPEERPFRER